MLGVAIALVVAPPHWVAPPPAAAAAPSGATPASALTATPVAVNLNYPAMFTVAPDGRIFYAELLTGRIGAVDPAAGTNSTYAQVPGLCTQGGQGLYGLAVAPTFSGAGTVYAYATRRGTDGACQNQLLTLTPQPRGPVNLSVLLADPYVGDHVGGRLLFGPDGNLYASTGDGAYGLSTSAAARAERALVQDVTSLKGKLLRVTAAGGVPSGNPWANAVFARGFRNVFGFDFDPVTGELWATENGPEADYPGEPSGPGPLGGCNDEIDVIVAGANYGWGASGSCGTPPAAPLNTNQDGPAPVLPALTLEVATGITGARFCSGCGLGPNIEGRLLYVKFDYRDGFGEIHAATLSPDRTSVVSDAVVYRAPHASPLSIERGPGGALYYSDQGAIYRLAPPPSTAHMTLVDSVTPSSGPSPLPVTYTYKVSNDGADTLANVATNDNKCAPASYTSGDVNASGALEPGEVWTFTCSRTYSSPATYTDDSQSTATSVQSGSSLASNVAHATVTVTVNYGR